MKTYKKRGIYIKLDHNGMPMYSHDNRNFYDTEREAKERKQFELKAEIKTQAAMAFDSMLGGSYELLKSIRV